MYCVYKKVECVYGIPDAMTFKDFFTVTMWQAKKNLPREESKSP